MKGFFLIIVLMTLPQIYFAQSKYYTNTTEKLLLLKTDAAANSEFDKAAEIKSELDLREQENNKISTLTAELNENIKSEKFNEATVVQKEINSLKKFRDKKDSLRLEIEKVIKEENFDKAIAIKDQLLSLRVNSPQKAIEAAPITQPIAETPKPRTESAILNTQAAKVENIYTAPTNTYSKPKEENSSKFLLAYSAGSYAPFGLILGGLKQRGVVLIASYRFSPNQFLSLDDATIEDKKISNTSANWHYTGYAFYSYASYNLGLSFRMFGNLDKVSCHLLPTIGMSRYRYIYEFEKTESYKNTVNVLDKDHSGYNFNFTPTLLLNFKFFNLHVGGEIGIPEMEESNVVFGAGFAF